LTLGSRIERHKELPALNGFLPLIEAFLAFALTMLALATAVSAIVGVWLRVFRWRALGLRQSLELIYDKEIQPRLSRAARRTTTAADRLGFVADMTLSLNVEIGATDRAAREGQIKALRASVQEPESSGAFTRWVSFLSRRFRRWRSLRLGLDYLTESQFQVRLDASQAGAALARQHGPDEWRRLKAYLTEVFTEVGVTATEAFARRSRVRTVIAGLVLAIGVNIDSFDLLNT
jgi:hypothetical protein